MTSPVLDEKVDVCGTNMIPERVTIDMNVARDYTERRERYDYVESLIDLARTGVVAVAVAASGYSYDVSDPHGDVAAQLRKLVTDERIGVLPQLAYPGPHTYPGTICSLALSLTDSLMR